MSKIDKICSGLSGPIQMKKFWWGIFGGALIGVMLLAPESTFSNNIKNLFYTIQFQLASLMEEYPTKFWPAMGIVTMIIGSLVAADLARGAPTDNDREIYLVPYRALVYAAVASFAALIGSLAGVKG